MFSFDMYGKLRAPDLYTLHRHAPIIEYILLPRNFIPSVFFFTSRHSVTFQAIDLQLSRQLPNPQNNLNLSPIKYSI